MTLQAKKSLGQHFLTDPNICRKIVRLAGIRPGQAVIEIGPGTGRLTAALLEAGALVTAVEIDSALALELGRRAQEDPAFAGLHVLEADVLHADWPALIEAARRRALGNASAAEAHGEQHARAPGSECGGVKIVGNLPYNIGTRIVKRMTPYKNRFHSFTFMVQKEVADRLCARPGGKDYGSLTLLAALHFERAKGFQVAPGSFVPPPQVTSAVMKLTPRSAALLPGKEAEFEKLVRRAFGQRRKTLANNLKGFAGRSDWMEALEACGIAPQARPQEVGLEQYCCLCRMLGFPSG